MSVSQEKRVVIYCLLLAAVTLAFYNPIVRNQFVDYDDLSYIVKNNHVLAGLTWDTVKWSFTTFRDGIWHPLTWLSHALDCQLFRLNPAGHHYTSLLLHTASAVLLFLLLWRATGCTWPSLVVAALFAVHPVNVESVAWAAERKNVLSTLFFLLTLHAYDRYARTGRRYLYFAVIVLFALGLLAKPQIVTLPFVLLLWDYWPLQRMAPDASSPAVPAPRSFAYLVWEKSPLFVLAAAESVVTVIAQRFGESVRTLAEVPWSLRLENVVVAYVRYIGKAFWPSPLVPLYPRPEHSLPAWQVVGSTALLFLVSVFVLLHRHRRYLPVGWFWFLGTLVPMIGIVTVGEQAMADRYAHIPFIGLFVAIVWALDAAASQRRVLRAALAGAAVLVVFILGCRTSRQVGYWHDNETLWRYTLSLTERNYVAHSNLGLALARLGRPDEAIPQFRAAKALHKYSASQVLALCYYELKVGDSQEAMGDCDEVLHDPADPKTQAAAWSGIGQGYLQLHRYDLAGENYLKALRLNPEDSGALIGTGLMALRQGQYDLAVIQFFHVVKVDPTDANVLLYAQSLRRAGRTAEADAALAQVKKIAEDIGQAQFDAKQMLSCVGVEPL